MTFKPYAFTVLLFLFAAKESLAQPGGGGGLYIMQLYDADKKLIQKNDPFLKLQQFILSKKKKPKEYTKKDWLYDYRNVDTTAAHIYIPSVIKKGSGEQYLPDVQLLLIFHRDTMIIDLIGMRRPNAGAYVDVMEKIEFKPGYFRCLRDPYQQLPNYIAHPQQNEMRKLLDTGLTDSTLDRLVHFGLLQYTLKMPVAGQYSSYDYSAGLAQQADSLINLFIMSPYPRIKENSFWVHDEKMQPLQHAVISWWSNNTASGEVKQSDSNGMYIIPKLDDGLYKIVITAEGYEPQTLYIQAYHNSTIRKKVALGKAGIEYINYYTLFGGFPCNANSFSEYVSFVNKKTMPPASDTIKMKQFEKELQDAISSITIQDDNLNTPFMRCIHWPAGEKERAHFRKQIEESDVIKTGALFIRECGGPGISSTVTFHVSGTISETMLRRAFKNSAFTILQSSTEGPASNEALYWKILAEYTPPLSLDLLREIKIIETSLPVLFIQLSETIKAELSGNKS